MHRMKTAFVTGGKKGQDGQMKDRDLPDVALNHWAVVQVNIVQSLM